MARTVNPGDSLTERELEVLRLLAAGHTKEAAARHLYLTRSTVNTHTSHAFTKLGACSTAQAVAVLARQGLLDPPTKTPTDLLADITRAAETAAAAGIPQDRIVVAALGHQPATRHQPTGDHP